jgi:rubredoxin
MKKQYACLTCGFVYDTYETTKRRIDNERSSTMGHTMEEFHGYEYYRVCPECGGWKSVGRVKDGLK